MAATISSTGVSAGPRRRRRAWAPLVGGAVLLAMASACFLSVWHAVTPNEHGKVRYKDELQGAETLSPPSEDFPMGTDRLRRSLVWRCLLGGAISLSIGLAAATITTFIGTTWGLVAGYAGGRIDAAMMRVVDVLYGLPYILLVVLLSVALEPAIEDLFERTQIEGGPLAANVITLLIAIGAVSWLTLARVVRGQVLSLKHQPFVEAARATGAGPVHIMARHILPNLVGPIIVYTTLTVPQAILQESFLSFLGIGVRPPLPSWGNLASEGLAEMNGVESHWWLLVWPCLLLGVTLLALNFLGDGLRDRFDPRARHRS